MQLQQYTEYTCKRTCITATELHVQQIDIPL